MKTTAAIVSLLLALSTASPIAKSIAVRQQPSGVANNPTLPGKKQIMVANGASPDVMAVGMLESEDMSTNYPRGDSKTDDSANWGIYKQNWGMLRQCCSRFKGQQSGDWNNGEQLNNDLAADTQCIVECMGFYGRDQWLAGHRDGSEGFANPGIDKVQVYVQGINWIVDQINGNPGSMSDDRRFWYQVPAI